MYIIRTREEKINVEIANLKARKPVCGAYWQSVNREHMVDGTRAEC